MAGYRPESAKIEATQAYAWFKEATDYLSKPRRDADKCGRYYDNEQWTKEELDALEERGQPPIIRNMIKPAIDLVLGTETKVRVDFKALPKTELHIQDADIATNLMKNVMDQCEGPYVMSEAFEGQCKPGWAVVEVCKQKDPFKEPVQIRVLDRNEVVWDPYAKKYNRDDAKYVIRSKWLDLSEAKALYPEWAEQLEAAVENKEYEAVRQPYEVTGDDVDPYGSVLDWQDGLIARKDWIQHDRKRVRLLEVWYKTYVKIMVIENTMTGDKQEFSFEMPGAAEMLMDPANKVYRASIKKVRMAMVAGPNVLEDDFSPYDHNEYPFVFFWGYSRDRTREPYGLIAQMVSPQDEVNKRASKALHILNTAQVIADKRAWKGDLEELRREAGRPDSVIIKDSSEGELEIRRDTNLAKMQYELMEAAAREINRPVPLELMGHQTNAKSGKAIQSRQVAGNTMLATLFQNYQRSRLRVGELIFSMIQQYYTAPMTLRVIDRGIPTFVKANEQLEDTSNGQRYIRNDVSRMKVDIKIDEQAFHASIREALFEQMMDLATKLPPTISLALLDLIVGYTDMPGRDEIVRRIQQIQAVAAQSVIQPEQGGPATQGG